MGFANFYMRFIQNYSRVVQLLTKLMKKLVLFYWGPNQNKVFIELETFTTAPVITNFDYKKIIVLNINVSFYISVEVLSQYNNHWVLYLVTFFLKKYTTAEENYEIYDKELECNTRSVTPGFIQSK